MRDAKTVLLAAVAAFGCAASHAAPQAGWYWNPDESGRGFFIESLDNLIYMAGYLYEQDGHALWVVSGGPNNDPYNYDGRLLTFNGGQTLGGTYRPPQPQQDIGAVSLHFTDDTHAILTWPGGVIQLQREIYGEGTPRFQPLTGWWWNPEESGRGYSIEVQGDKLFFVGFMYEADGRPVWYFSAGPVNAERPATYSGPLLQFANGQTMRGGYQPPGAPVTIGRLDVAFTASNAGTLTFTKSGSLSELSPKQALQTTTPIVPEFAKPGSYVPDDWFVGTFHEDIIALPVTLGLATLSAEHRLTGKNLTWQKNNVLGDTGEVQYILLGGEFTVTMHDRSIVPAPDVGMVTCDSNSSGTASVRYPFTSSSQLTVDAYERYTLTLSIKQELLDVKGTIKCVGPGGGVVEGFELPPLQLPFDVQNQPGVVEVIGLPGTTSYGEITDTIVNTGPFLSGSYTQTIGFDFLGTDECMTSFCPAQLGASPKKTAPAARTGAVLSNRE